MAALSALSVLVAVPRALAAYGLFRALRALTLRAMARRAAGPMAWRLLDAGLLQDDRTLTALSLVAPRWNPHALIAVGPPVEVQAVAAVDRALADAWAPRWTLSAQGPLGQHAEVGAANTRADAPLATLRLSPGRWRFTLRGYGPRPGAPLPPLLVDGVERLPALPTPPDALRFFEGLAGRARPLHRRVNAWVLPALRWRRALGEARVARAFLPVGNPETRFRFGALAPGQRLRVQAPPGMSPGGVYLCLYDGASFPVWFAELPPEGLLTPPAAEAGTWLVRLVDGRGESRRVEDLLVQVE